MRSVPVNERAVVIVGAGPTGLMLAGELALAQVDVVILERRTRQQLDEPRAKGLHARTLEVLDQRGILERCLAQGQVVQVAGFGWIRLDISDCPTRYPHGLALPQQRFETILADWIGELDVPILRGCEVTALAQDEAGVDITHDQGPALRAQYLIGCDGGRSVVRKAAGIAFTGCDPTESQLIAEVQMTAQPPWGLRHDARGINALSALKDEGGVGVLVTEPSLGGPGNPTLQDLSAALVAVYGTDFGAHSPSWISRFTDLTRQAAAYRDRRVLLAGDAAHVHPPVGGQGLNMGVQDAVNLGWKLAQVIQATAPASLLDTYHAERHPVAAQVLQLTLAQSALLRRSDERLTALRGILAEVLGMEAPRRRFGALMSGLDVRYELGAGHALLGRRMPDLDLITADGPLRLFTLLHAARPVFLVLDAPDRFDLGGASARIRRVDARYLGDWELPVVGPVPAPGAVLIRPDGYVAWVDVAGPPLTEVLAGWFGPPRALA